MLHLLVRFHLKNLNKPSKFQVTGLCEGNIRIKYNSDIINLNARNNYEIIHLLRKYLEFRIKFRRCTIIPERHA